MVAVHSKDVIALKGGIELTFAEAARYLRLAHAITVDSAQGKTHDGKILVVESGQRHMTRERLLVAVSRATDCRLLCIQ